METAQNIISKTNLINYTGTETWWRDPLTKILYTDGVKYLLENGAAWLVSDCILYCTEYRKQHEFLSFKLNVNLEEKTASLKIGDGNKTINTVELTYTDFPLESVILFFTDNVLMLASEY